MLIRKIEPKDNSAVALIIRSVMTEFGAVGEGFSILDPEVDGMYEAYDNDQSTFYVVEHKNRVVGCGGVGALVGADQQVCELKKMYFLEFARGRGLGRILGEMLIADAGRLGYRTMYIETLQRLEAANRLYQKLGFERIPRSMGNTGHCGCDIYYAMRLEPIVVTPSLLE